jgi:cystathionine beta-synthase
LQPGQIVVTIICDTGRNYLSKFFDDAWLAANNLTTTEQVVSTAGDLLRHRGARPLVFISPDANVAEAIDQMQNAGISQLPVLKEGQAAGSIQEVTLARVLHDKEDPATVRVGDVMARPLPQVDRTVHLDEVYRLLLSGNTGVLVTSEGKVLDIITRIDLVQYYKSQRGK